jgi:hypothetical protein
MNGLRIQQGRRGRRRNQASASESERGRFAMVSTLKSLVEKALGALEASRTA